MNCFLSSAPASLARLLIFLMSGNAHPNPGPVFPCSVCASNMTWSGRSVKCCTCSKWVHLRCSQLTFSRFKTLGSSHSWSCPPCCVPASYGAPTPTNTVSSSSGSSSLFTSTVQSAPSSAKAMLPPHPRLQTFYPPSAHFLSTPSSPSHLLMGLLLFYTSCFLFLSDVLTILQWNVGEFRARCTELLDFISSHPVDLICVQESNLNSSSSFRNPGYSALRSDRTHSRSNILSPDDPHASGDVVIFIRQSRSFSELSTSPFSSPDSYSNYAGINMLLNNFLYSAYSLLFDR